MTETSSRSLAAPDALVEPAAHRPQARSALASGIAALLSFETLFLLYLGAGRYKGMPEFAWFPVDFTLTFLAVSIAAAALLSSTRINVLDALQDVAALWFLAFLGWVLLSVLWSSYGEFSRTKLVNTLVLLSWSFLGGYLFVAEDMARVRRFLIGLVVFSLALLGYWAYYRFVLGVVDLPAEEEVNNYLVYGYHAQFVAAALVAGAIASRGAAVLAACMVGLAAILVTMLFIGGRGPLIFALLTVPLACLILLTHPKAWGYRGRFLTVVLWLVVLLLGLQLLIGWLGPYLFEQLSEQMTTLIRLFGSLHEADLGASVNDRVIGQELALARWAEAPFIGWGIGEFGRLYPDLEYPHNLLLELLMELGLVGFWLLLALLVIGLVRAWRLWPARPDWAPIALIILFVTLLLSRMTVQGFLPDERILFALLGMILGLGRRAAQKPS